MITCKATLLSLALGLAVGAGACQQNAANRDARTVPPNVAAALERRSPGAKVTGFYTRERADGTKRWHLRYVTPDGSEGITSFEGTVAPAE